LFESVGPEVAAVIVEPVAGNMGCVPPEPGFLELLRELTSASGALLIFDEVMTGFRVARGGAQEMFGIVPDLTTLGKVIGGGMPVGAYGGRGEIMDHVAPSGPVYQAGTLSGNPLAVAAGLATLERLRSGEAYDRLEALGERFERGILEVAVERGARIQVNRVGSMLTIFFSDGPVTDFRTASASDIGEFRRFFGNLLDRGVYWPPSAFEAAFISTAHSEDVIDRTIDAIGESL
jgi:glutamate-1-semialdehyde 2,1-aminomutase